MDVAAAVMVMAHRDWPVTVPIRIGIGNLFRRHMDMSRVVIVLCFDQSDGGPVGCMGEVVLRLRQAVQVHGCRHSDAQTDAEVTKGARQIEAPVAPLAPTAVVGNAWTCARPQVGTSIVRCWRWAQPVNATCYFFFGEGAWVMKQRRRIYYSAAQRAEIWDRWKAGESMSSIGRSPRSGISMRGGNRVDCPNVC